jgi:hypothetical protein
MIKPFTVFKTVILDSKFDIRGDYAQIECSFGCNGNKHAIFIEELIYVDDEVVHGIYISSQEIGKCTCYTPVVEDPINGFILENQIKGDKSIRVDDLQTLETTYF